MRDDEFFDWFVERVHTFADLGIMHPNSEQGKIVKICAVTIEEKFKELNERIAQLESEIEELKSERKPARKSSWSI